MDRLRELTAAGKPVQIGGKSYWMEPLKVQHFGEAEEYMLSLQPKPLDVVLPRLAELPEVLQKHLLDRAYEDEKQGRWLSKEEVLNWLTKNPRGRLFSFWCWIKQSHPEITMEEAERLRDQLVIEEGEPAPDLGLPEGNLPGQAPVTVETANGAPFHGAPSTAT